MRSAELKRLLSRGQIVLNATPLLCQCEPDWKWSPGALDDYVLVVVFGGRGQVKIDECAFCLRRGLCIFITPAKEISAEQNPQYPLFLFIARLKILDTSSDSVESEFNSALQQVFIRNLRPLEALAEVISNRSGPAGQSDGLSNDALTMLLRLVVEEASNNSGSFDSRVYEAFRAIEDDLARRWTVADLSLEAQLSKKDFTKSFRSMMNETPIQYVSRRRLEEARRQILQSNLPIPEIAINLGFNQVASFEKSFRNFYSCSPQSIRKTQTI